MRVVGERAAPRPIDHAEKRHMSTRPEFFVVFWEQVRRGEKVVSVCFWMSSKSRFSYEVSKGRLVCDLENVDSSYGEPERGSRLA
jgi:hypothetical protein